MHSPEDATTVHRETKSIHSVISLTAPMPWLGQTLSDFNIFGRNIPKALRLKAVISFPVSPNLCFCATGNKKVSI